MTPRRLIATAMVTLGAAGVDAADAPEMAQRFYRTELVIFARASPGQTSESGERLGLAEPRRYRAPLVALGDPVSSYGLASDEDWLPFRGEPATRELRPKSPLPTPTTVAPAPPSPADQVRQSLAQLEAQWFAESFTPVPAAALALVDQSQRLTRAPGMRVVWHGAWVQPVPDRDNDPHLPVLLQAGAHTADGWEVSGRIDLTLGRFLHCDVELWMPGAVPGEFHVLAESRRLRSGELNYLDHPAFGVLVRIDPRELPPELALEIAALEKPGQ